jgi:YfiR/HmsC-like
VSKESSGSGLRRSTRRGLDGAVPCQMTLGTTVLTVMAIAWYGTLTAATPEYAVKSAYLLNFAKFTEWPNTEAPINFTVCLIGRDPFGGFLDEAVRGKQAHGRPVLIRRLPAGDEHMDGCQILFFSGPARIESTLCRLQGRSILTVGESDGFSERGGMIGLVMDHGSVRFDLNLAAIAAARLQVSSRLIEIGRVVGPRK